MTRCSPTGLAAGGRNKRDTRLMAILNVSHQMAEAATALRTEGERPPQWVTDTVGRLADAVARGAGGDGGAALDTAAVVGAARARSRCATRWSR